MEKMNEFEKISAPDYAAKLLSAVAGSNKNLDRLIGIGGEMLCNPIVITDKTWKAIAITANADIPDDPLWQELLVCGYLSADSVATGIREKLAEKLESSSNPFVWQGSDMRYPRLMNKVSINGRLAVTVSVIEFNKPFTDGDTILLKLFCDAVAAQLQKDGFRRFTKGVLYEEFIENLLDGKLHDPNIIDARVKVLNVGIKKNAYVFVFDITDSDPGRYSITYMRDTLEKMISGGQALVYEGNIVIASSFLRSQDIFKTELLKLGEFLKKHNIRCGISRRCAKLHELRFHYEQALDALRVGTHLDPNRFIYPYGEYAIYHVAEICSESGKSKTFFHPALRTLMDYDEEYGSAFTLSLYTYISHFKSVSKAAITLNLHRNTFVYHLKRISEIMEIDLSNSKTVQLIELSFRILEYEKKLVFQRDDNNVIEKEN